jgi:flagellar protein FliO/FliZ
MPVPKVQPGEPFARWLKAAMEKGRQKSEAVNK